VREPNRREPLQRIDVRELELDDLAAVFALGERIFTADQAPTLHRTWDPYEVVSFFQGDPETCLVALDEQTEKICGFALGTVLEKRRSAWTYGYLVWLGVDPAYGNAGVGGKLLADLTERFIEQGARMLLVDTEADNDRALKFFARNGFGHPRPHVFLSKNLTREPAYRKARKPKGNEPAK
jgi:ribosomal protein S18 acetylase RimI-like enzyme